MFALPNEKTSRRLVVPDQEQDKKRKIIWQSPKKQTFVTKSNIQKKARFSFLRVLSF